VIEIAKWNSNRLGKDGQEILGKVALKGITKRFGDKTAVNKLDLQVADGEFMCLLGPSGAGKTTTFRMIAGVERPDEGEIYIDDVLVNQLPPKDRDIAMMFQSYALYPHKTVYENIAYPLKKRGLSDSDIKNRVNQVAETLGISSLLDRLPKQLSGGEKQRVAMGRAIIRQPKALLLDEPLTNLDAKLREQMRGEFKRLRRELKTTIILATPDQLEAISMGDRVAVMDFGNLLQFDSPDVLYNHPTNLFIAGFVGSPAMNLVECTLVDTNGRVLLDAGDFTYDVSRFKDQIKQQATSSELTLGIRPEHISMSRSRADGECYEAEIYVVEPARPDIVVEIRVGKRVLTALAPETFRANMGDKVWITFDQEKIHIFDKKTENAIV